MEGEARVARRRARAASARSILAAGTGDIAFAIAARGAKTIGLDITHRMLQLAFAKARQQRDHRACRVHHRRHDEPAVSIARRSIW